MYVGALRGNIRISVPLSSPLLQSKPPSAFGQLLIDIINLEEQSRERVMRKTHGNPLCRVVPGTNIGR